MHAGDESWVGEGYLSPTLQSQFQDKEEYNQQSEVEIFSFHIRTQCEMRVAG